jgi:RNA polymerase sigma-70 factor (ECF subfamily)
MSALTLTWPALSLAATNRKTAAMSEPAPAADEALVAAALEGDNDAFTELVRRHKRRVFAAAARFARDDHQLDDIAQEVFVRVFRNLGKFRGDAPFEHWLARITVSACYDFLRKERRVREQVALDAVEYELHDVGIDAVIAAGRARELLAFAMRRLTPDEQLIITLCEIEERPVRDVAELTGWSESNVKVRAFRARQSLRKILETSHER